MNSEMMLGFGVKRILIWYVSIGSGHLSAARAIQAALEQRNPGWEVRIEDAIGWQSRPRGMTDMLSAVSTVVIPGVYDWAWRTGAMQAFFTATTWMPATRHKTLQVTRQFRPDVVVCTHALPCAILAHQRSQTPLVGVATDFDVHPYWPVEGVSAYVTATTRARDNLARRGVAPQTVQVFGIPVQPAFSQDAPHAMQTAADFHVLALAGSGALGPYLPVIPRIRQILDLLTAGPVEGVRWTFVFGKNEALLQTARRQLADRDDVTLLGFTSDMPALMASADVVITKPGGLALAESLALGKPVLLLQRGAGQERANYQAVISGQAGALIENGQALFDWLRTLRQKPEVYQRMRECACALGAPMAAQRTAELIERLSAGGQDAH